VAHLSSETSTLKAMRAVHALWHWIAEMMVPPEWRRSKEQSSCLSLQWSNAEKLACELVSGTEWLFCHLKHNFCSNESHPCFALLDCGDDGAT
jgi:hypothetical protein